MSGDFSVRIFDLNVSRRTSDAPFDNPGEAGDISRIEVGASRSKPSDSNAARYTVNYRVREGIAEVVTVEPTERAHSDPTVETSHLAHILVETDVLVAKSVPEVKCTKSLNESLRNERAKHTDGNAAGEVETMMDNDRAVREGTIE